MRTKEEVAMAMSRNEFIPFFQPKFELATGAVTCVEMLARWNHPKLGILLPSQFIGLIERAGIMGRFTDKLFRLSLAGARNSAKNGMKIGMAVNFSLVDLQDSDTPGRICSLVKEYGLSFDQITIEVTESATIENYSSVIKSLTTLRSQGFKISIDDFGTGYSSLKLLNDLPFTELKIDRMFVAGISKNMKLTAILESIVDMARRLKLSTVAEGIETKNQLDFIRDLGCTAGQGFYLGAPIRNLNLLVTANAGGESAPSVTGARPMFGYPYTSARSSRNSLNAPLEGSSTVASM